MKKKIAVLGRLTALLLVILLTAGLAPLPACAASDTHFSDVPSGHWAFRYVERAYGDGAIIGTGGNPEAGTGIFSPNANMTYGQFLTMLVRAFYPEELGRVSKEGPWYAPAIRVAVNRQLNFNTQDDLMAMANDPINRYNAAWFLVRILEDKCVVLPDDQERAAAAAAIGDWDTMLEDEYWRYFVSSIYALGIITGVDKAGTFDGAGYITRASAAAIYTRMADKLKADGNDPKAFQVTFEGDWSAAPEGYQEALEEEFYTVYPRLWARFGSAENTKHVTMKLVPQEKMENPNWIGVTHHGYDYTRYHTTAEIVLSEEYFRDWRYAAALAAHEFTHAATGATFRRCEQSTWLIECLAGYGIFRYTAWMNEEYMSPLEFYYQPEDKALRTWAYDQSPDAHWFFAYMDSKYPTTSDGYGLLDSILLAMRNGQVTTDGGKTQDDSNLNAVVKEKTGYDSLEALRQQYIKELDAGTWTFNGFAGFADNYITENLPGVPNPNYFTSSDFNLCTHARIHNDPGEASAALAAANLVDSDRSTKWEAARGDVNAKDTLQRGVQHAISIALDKPVTFDTYVLYHEGSQGDSNENTKAWRIYYYDAQKNDWVSFDEVQGNTRGVTTHNVEPVTAQYLWLDILDSSGTGDGTVRLYELELYRRGASS